MCYLISQTNNDKCNNIYIILSKHPRLSYRSLKKFVQGLRSFNTGNGKHFKDVLVNFHDNQEFRLKHHICKYLYLVLVDKYFSVHTNKK